jgi:uncharacterized membrane protein YciS (DUF1049 family)
MKQLRNIITVLVLLAVVFAGVLFALQNKVAVPLDLLVYSFSPRSLALWVLLAFGLGGVAGLLISSFILLRARTTLAGCRRQLARARTELDQLRGKELQVSE